jgi:hypothetical protein
VLDRLHYYLSYQYLCVIKRIGCKYFKKKFKKVFLQVLGKKKTTAKLDKKNFIFSPSYDRFHKFFWCF